MTDEVILAQAQYCR